MNKSIYKIFNSDEIVTYKYDELSDEEVNSIMSRFKSEYQQKKIHSKKLIRRFTAVLAAAVIAVSGGIFAYAYDKGLLQIIFGGENESYINLDGLTGEMEVQSLEVYRDDVTVTPEGYASDGTVIYCVFRMDFDKPLFRSANAEYSELFSEIEAGGKKYHEMHYSDKVMELGEMLPTGYKSSVDAQTSLKRADDDTMYAIFKVAPSMMSEGRKELDYTCFNIGMNNKPLIDEHIFSAEFSVNVTESGNVHMKTDGTFLEGCTLTVTPCTVRIEKDSAELFSIVDELIELTDDTIDQSFYILMNDGNKVYFDFFSGSSNQPESGNGYTELTAQIHMPVDINNAAAVVMGKYTFSVEQEQAIN